MRLLYLIGAIIVFLLVLILALPQVGTTCIWYVIDSTSNPGLVLMQTAGLGAVLGGLLVLYWKSPKKGQEDEDVEEPVEPPTPPATPPASSEEGESK